jgi:hypothetical protein
MMAASKAADGGHTPSVVPAQFLRGLECRFTIVPPAGYEYTQRDGTVRIYTGKNPRGMAWAETGGSNYAEDDPRLLQAIANTWNYGLVTGTGGVVVFDADRMDRLEELGIIKKLPPTVKVESRPGHRHYYYSCPELKKKFVFYDPIETEIDAKTGTVQRLHLGEVLGPGGHAILPGSIHPSGSRYEIVPGGPEAPARLTLEDLNDICRGLMFSADPESNRSFEEVAGIKPKGRARLEEIERQARKARRGDGLLSLSEQIGDIRRVLNAYDWTPTRTEGDEAKGPHPTHGSSNGDNLQINVSKGTWHCKRCDAGGDAASLVGLFEGEISCTGHVLLQRNLSLFSKVLDAARSKGLIPDEPKAGTPKNKGSDDPEDRGGDKEGSIATRLVNLVTDSGVELWRSDGGDAFITISIGDHIENHPLASREVKSWLSQLMYRSDGKAPKSSAIQDAISVLEANSLFDGEEYQTHVRLAEFGGRFYLDLGSESWEVVEVGPDGWRVIPSHEVPVKFRRARGMQALPVPQRGGNLEELRQVLNVPLGAPWILVRAWLIQAFRPTGPYPILIVNGEQGCGKSWLVRVLRYLVDPNQTPLRRPPKTEADLMIAAVNSWVVAYDNLSGLPPWLADAI